MRRRVSPLGARTLKDGAGSPPIAPALKSAFLAPPNTRAFAAQVRTRVARSGDDLLVTVEVEGVPAAQRTPLLLSWCVERGP